MPSAASARPGQYCALCVQKGGGRQSASEPPLRLLCKRVKASRQKGFGWHRQTCPLQGVPKTAGAMTSNA